MSYTGEIETVPLVAELAFGVLSFTVGNVGRAVFGVATAPARIPDAITSARLHGVNEQLDSAMTNIFHFDEKVSAELASARADIDRQYSESLSQIQKRLESSGDTDIFIAECSAAAEKLCNDIEAAQKEFDEKYISAINTEMKKCTAETAILRRNAEDIIARAENDEKKKEAAAGYAEKMIASLRSALEVLDARDSKKAAEAVRLCSEQLDKAEQRLASGMSEAALIDVYSAEDAFYLRLQDILTAEATNRQRYINAKTALTQLREAYDAAKHGEMTFESTASGTPITKTTDDMPLYFRGDYERIGGEIAVLEKMLEGSYTDIGREELADIRRRTARIGADFTACTRTAYERMHNELLRKETAKVLAARYRSKGYSLIPLTAKDKEYSPLDRIVLRFQKNGTDERLYLFLDANENGGHVNMKIDIEDHTDYEGGFDEVELAREKERKANCEAIKSSAVGKAIGLKQRCKNPGVIDTYRPE
ncbi:MAG: hypothetical protein J6I96_06520 [Oscillospiraceae bacterium]|nr:hypothetical protein [Oscillospiraceae bacterium]